MIRRAVDRPARLGEPAQGIAERAAVRVADRDVVQARRSGRRRGAAAGLPGIQPEVMVIAPARDEERAGVAADRDVQPDDARVEALGCIQVGDVQVDVSNARPLGHAVGVRCRSA